MGFISEGERTIYIQSQQAATLHMITIRVILPQLQWLDTPDSKWAQAWLKAKGEHPPGESNPWPCAPQVRFVAAHASSCSSGLVLPASSALVKWQSGRISQGPWGSRLFRGQVCTWPATWAESIQTTAPYGLGYSMSLACPLKFII